MRNYVTLAASQLIGGHAEYYVLCELGVPSLRSIWGAVRNRQLYILRMYCKGWISFNFSIFLIIYTTYRKKKITRLTAKIKKFSFFHNSHAFTAKKKLHDYPVFLYTTYIFHCTGSFLRSRKLWRFFFRFNLLLLTASCIPGSS